MEVIRRAVLRRSLRIIASRPPDFVITRQDGEAYLQRWWVIPRNPIFNIYLHRFLGDDDDRALHDHMYVNLSWVLDGGYFEVTPSSAKIGIKKRWYPAGSIKARLPSSPHRIVLKTENPHRVNGTLVEDVVPCVSLFFTGPRVRRWGFHCPNGWVHWKDFVGAHQGGLGRGCDG